MAQKYYHHPFFGLFLYLLSHVLVVYYLLWMLAGYAGVPPEWQFVEELFPNHIYRLVLPGLFFAFLGIYFTTVWILRRMKLAQQKEF
jgi:hypothetical protein